MTGIAIVALLVRLQDGTHALLTSVLSVGKCFILHFLFSRCDTQFVFLVELLLFTLLAGF